MADSTDELGIDRYYRSFSAGTTLYYAGAPAAELYLIRSGRVRLVKRARGVERTIGLYCADEIIGEEALLAGAHRSASAEAIEPVSACNVRTWAKGSCSSSRGGCSERRSRSTISLCRTRRSGC
ncbi:MAG: cyclic nucleotide-binding domain-containing protein [Deltaproteobacteria bacterium]|nr:cyclic nucleotide-binding domain-containing protein [Deltaproteobacteria bacterium]